MISRCIINNLLPLPDDPKDIPSYINDTLSFELPLTNRYDTRQVVRVLCKAFIFQILPEIYFKDNRLPLPEKIEELHYEIRDLFPISSRADLKQLSNYKQALQKYYLCNRIPSHFFDLPEKLPPLPVTLNFFLHTLKQNFLFSQKAERILLTISESYDLNIHFPDSQMTT